MTLNDKLNKAKEALQHLENAINAIEGGMNDTIYDYDLWVAWNALNGIQKAEEEHDAPLPILLDAVEPPDESTGFSLFGDLK